jgi:hypothetical protein
MAIRKRQQDAFKWLKLSGVLEITDLLEARGWDALSEEQKMTVHALEAVRGRQKR